MKSLLYLWIDDEGQAGAGSGDLVDGHAGHFAHVSQDGENDAAAE